MQNPVFYNKVKSLQLNDVRKVLGKYLPLMQWKPGDISLDIGCGDGDITVNELLTKIPSVGRNFVAVDISPEMVEYASANYANECVNYQLMDMEAPEVAVDHLDKYDHIFLLNCLHWTQDFKHAMKNVFKMLKNGGDFLLTMPLRHNIFESYKVLSQYPKWKNYMIDYKKSIPPLHYSTDPAEEFRKFLCSLGFQNIRSESIKMNHTFHGEKCLRDTAKAVNPFMKKMTPDLQQEYLDDYIKFVKFLGIVGKDANETGQYSYYNLIAYGTKNYPENK